MKKVVAEELKMGISVRQFPLALARVRFWLTVTGIPVPLGFPAGKSGSGHTQNKGPQPTPFGSEMEVL